MPWQIKCLKKKKKQLLSRQFLLKWKFLQSLYIEGFEKHDFLKHGKRLKWGGERVADFEGQEETLDKMIFCLDNHVGRPD